MDCKSLMIGDWVYEGSNHPIQVLANYGRSVRYDEDGSHEVEETCLTPIPITEEILKANGFKCRKSKSDVSLTYKNKETSVNIHIYYDTICVSIYGCIQDYCPSYRSGRINYIHELQHALRLCGMHELADSIYNPKS